ncbi:MAG: hypothetical protein AAB801_02470 [Patescibacteria group bacterium]
MSEGVGERFKKYFEQLRNVGLTKPEEGGPRQEFALSPLLLTRMMAQGEPPIITQEEMIRQIVEVGLLARRGRLFQEVGDEKLPIKIGDFDEVLIPHDPDKQRAVTFSLDPHITKLIIATGTDPQNWINRAATLWQRLNTVGFLLLTGEEQYQHLWTRNLPYLWESLNFPPPQVTFVQSSKPPQPQTPKGSVAGKAF